MTKWLKDKLESATGTEEGQQAGGGQVSSGPNSFESTETSVGGADSVPGTPDATPSSDLGEDDTPRAAGAS
ncbi:MAG: hypothetical protein AVDCRST_MAG61-2543 [uncultured Friedmanniella sp.]|uniref:Uncharacterized protein n=1 Tax=uncultured Friedmanniella sp. TaxID=335381 RepID=A0A6J4L763_9ACTN|nr:hypothetical protein [uncultured Friedmanniella sp.]CAA9324915.1 MAG: hypothetical protein AVDCRST_MAG61-2543 [uncultured Friedmanniella sp.]